MHACEVKSSDMKISYSRNDIIITLRPGWRGEDASRRQSSWFMTVGVVFCFDPAGHKTARQRCDSQQPRNIRHPSSRRTSQ